MIVYLEINLRFTIILSLKVKQKNFLYKIINSLSRIYLIKQVSSLNLLF